MLNEIPPSYVDAIVRDDIETSDHKDGNDQLPGKGMQVHESYMMYAHFLVLARLLKNAEKVRVYMDQDSGFGASCHCPSGHHLFWLRLNLMGESEKQKPPKGGF